MAKYDYSIIVIGAGAGGLVVAIGAAKAGKRVLLVERGTWGGDCTNFGCIPSKSLIASAHVAHAIRHADHWGIRPTSIDFTADQALERVRRIVQTVRHHEEPDQLHKLGVPTFSGTASFEDPHTLRLEGGDEIRIVTSKQIVIATGSHPFISPTEGLKDVPYLTNETIFDLRAIPKRLAVMGGGPIGCELAQAFARLGSEVTLLQKRHCILPREESEATEVIRKVFQEDTISLRCETEVQRVWQDQREIKLQLFHKEQKETTLTVDQLLVATGHRPNLSALQLGHAGVAHTEKGITVDVYGRSSQKHIWAIGDATGPPFFTHLAEHHGRAVLASLLLPGPFKKTIDQKQAVPRCTYLDPEIGSVGLTEAMAHQKYRKKKIATYLYPLEQDDRSITVGRTEGFVKVVTKKWSSRILGATIVAPRAGEMLSELTLAMHRGIPLRKLASLIHAYPTFSRAIRQCADQWLTQTVLGSLKR